MNSVDTSLACPEARPPPDISEDPRRGSSFFAWPRVLMPRRTPSRRRSARPRRVWPRENGHEAPMMRFRQLNLTHPPTRAPRQHFKPSGRKSRALTHSLRPPPVRGRNYRSACVKAGFCEVLASHTRGGPCPAGVFGARSLSALLLLPGWAGYGVTEGTEAVTMATVATRPGLAHFAAPGRAPGPFRAPGSGRERGRRGPVDLRGVIRPPKRRGHQVGQALPGRRGGAQRGPYTREGNRPRARLPPPGHRGHVRCGGQQPRSVRPGPHTGRGFTRFRRGHRLMLAITAHSSAHSATANIKARPFGSRLGSVTRHLPSFPQAHTRPVGLWEARRQGLAGKCSAGVRGLRVVKASTPQRPCRNPAHPVDQIARSRSHCAYRPIALLLTYIPSFRSSAEIAR